MDIFIWMKHETMHFVGDVISFGFCNVEKRIEFSLSLFSVLRGPWLCGFWVLWKIFALCFVCYYCMDGVFCFHSAICFFLISERERVKRKCTTAARGKSSRASHEIICV